MLAVVGQPADWIKALDAAAVRPVAAGYQRRQGGGFYKKARLVYPQFGAAVDTYSVQRLLVTRNFKTPDKKAQLLKYQRLRPSQIDRSLQEDEGMHPKWNEVTFKSPDWPDYK